MAGRFLLEGGALMATTKLSNVLATLGVTLTVEYINNGPNIAPHYRAKTSKPIEWKRPGNYQWEVFSHSKWHTPESAVGNFALNIGKNPVHDGAKLRVQYFPFMYRSIDLFGITVTV